jgi:hypothetical protein
MSEYNQMKNSGFRGQTTRLAFGDYRLGREKVNLLQAGCY